MLDQQKFWEVLKYLTELDYQMSYQEICENLKITKRQLNAFISFLKDVNYEFDALEVQDEKVLRPPTEKPQVKIEMTLFEWLQFQAHFPVLETVSGRPYHANIARKLSKVEDEFKAHDLYGPLETLEQKVAIENIKLRDVDQIPKGELVSFIEESILEQKVLSLSMDHKQYVLFPRKLIYIDNQLSLVAESLNEKCLLNIPIENISNIFEQDRQWTQMFTKMEVDDFVSSLRSIHENEIRLVLKIYNRERFDSQLPVHQFSKACIFTNPDGDFIWAASVEPNHAIHEWLSELGTDIEILDPIQFKKDFLSYCEHKLKKLA
jgi:predicted DNA-binding transcriptional regulator YafY